MTYDRQADHVSTVTGLPKREAYHWIMANIREIQAAKSRNKWTIIEALNWAIQRPG